MILTPLSASDRFITTDALNALLSLAKTGDDPDSSQRIVWINTSPPCNAVRVKMKSMASVAVQPMFIRPAQVPEADNK